VRSTLACRDPMPAPGPSPSSSVTAGSGVWGGCSTAAGPKRCPRAAAAGDFVGEPAARPEAMLANLQSQSAIRVRCRCWDGQPPLLLQCVEGRNSAITIRGVLSHHRLKWVPQISCHQQTGHCQSSYLAVMLNSTTHAALPDLTMDSWTRKHVC
jgi:hypothetical protein